MGAIQIPMGVREGEVRVNVFVVNCKRSEPTALRSQLHTYPRDEIHKITGGVEPERL